MSEDTTAPPHRVIGVRLQYAPANVRALVVQALREKADGDREAASSLHPDSGDAAQAVARELMSQAQLADDVAEEFECA